MTLRVASLALAIFSSACPGTVGAQRVETIGAVLRARERLISSALPHESSSGETGIGRSLSTIAPREQTPAARRSPSTPWAILGSAAIPGTGQALLRQDRFVAYLSVEGFAWARYFSHAREGRRERNAYRILARDVARALFSETRPVGGFDYYEQMEHFVESGAYDLLPGGDLEPELDANTYNGAVWLLARQTFWDNPFDAPPRDGVAYQSAERFYRERAIRPEYRWSWRNAQLEYDEFRRTIRRSNNAYRRSLEDLGIIIANHALSTVDAFITVRLRSRVAPQRFDVGSPQRYNVTATIPFGGPRRPK